MADLNHVEARCMHENGRHIWCAGGNSSSVTRGHGVGAIFSGDGSGYMMLK